MLAIGILLLIIATYSHRFVVVITSWKGNIAPANNVIPGTLKLRTL